ncbi:uncharacterized protein A4U43_C04F15460 [Asparagus officinalis]|uniref:Uncharacterized protein n=1 Tax=Asparagus officinalis TaxID=4686 RepID=A0A5P1F134_ASPOF|nr:uncharacterized protein A4U43_C04F15460 [Asparagus officinalis]
MNEPPQRLSPPFSARRRQALNLLNGTRAIATLAVRKPQEALSPFCLFRRISLAPDARTLLPPQSAPLPSLPPAPAPASSALRLGPPVLFVASLPRRHDTPSGSPVADARRCFDDLQPKRASSSTSLCSRLHCNSLLT